MTKSDALKREFEIKQLTRKEKDILINQFAKSNCRNSEYELL
jgi:predicted GIY-YIG superfamily endonuclease